MAAAKKKPGLYDADGKRVYVTLVPGRLGKYGYTDVRHMASGDRRKALAKAVAAEDWLSLFRRLNYLAILNKHHARLHAIFIADRNYVKRIGQPAPEKPAKTRCGA